MKTMASASVLLALLAALSADISGVRAAENTITKAPAAPRAADKAADPSSANKTNDLRLLIGVEHALPVRGQPCRVWAKLAASDAAPAPAQAEVTFWAAWDGGERVRLDLECAAGDLGGDSPVAQVRWTPERLGRCRISAAALVRKDGEPVRLQAIPIDVFVTTRRLHFNYWQCGREQRYATSVLDNSKDAESPWQWRRRGVLALGWQGGQWLWANGANSPEKVAGHWLSVPQGRAGVMIDEFGGGDAVDQQLGKSLLLTRERNPRLFLAAYCLSVGGKEMTEGLGQSDLILVETYTADWRWDGMLTGRWQTAVQAGLTEKSIAVLGLGSSWIGTESELRRTFRMVRANCPDMPGIGFFPNVPPRLTKAVDAAIEDYFLRPVVTATVRENWVVVRNIGEQPATQVKLAFLDAEHARLPSEKTVAHLDPWAEVREALPPQAVEAKVVPAPDRYSTLEYVPPLEMPKPDAEAREAAARFRKLALSGETSDPLARASEMRVDRTDDRHKDPDYHSNVQSANLPIRPNQGRAVALAFDLRLGRSWFYGGNSISLDGEGTLALHWSHGDHDAGLSGDQPRPSLSFTGKDEYSVRDVPTIGFRYGQTYRVLLAHDGRDSVRAIVTDANDELLWDSGPLPAQGGLNCTALRFGVGAFKGSDIRCDANKGEVFLRGGGGGPLASPYVLESTLSNLRLVVAP